MKLNRLSIALSATVLGAVALVGCRNEPAAPPAEPGPMTATPPPVAAPTTTTRTTDTAVLSTVELGTMTGENDRIVSPTTRFSAADADIHAVIVTHSDSFDLIPDQIVARWTYQDGQVVDESSQRLNFTSGESIERFTISNANQWPTGSYTLTVLIDDNVVNTTNFTIQ